MFILNIYKFQLQKNKQKIEVKRSKYAEKKRKLLKELQDNALNEAMTLERETILAMDITELLDKLKNGELDPLAVLQAYQVRILKIYNFKTISQSTGCPKKNMVLLHLNITLLAFLIYVLVE